MHVARPTGTGDRKPLSVPGICWFLLLRRVQQHKNRFLYPAFVLFHSSGGHSSTKTASCTRNLPIFALPAGTAAHKTVPVPVALMRERNFRNPFDGCLALVHNLKNVELQVLFEQMLDFTGFSGTRFLNLPLAYHSFFRYIKFAIRSISSVSVLSRTWQYRSIVICKEL